MNTFSWIFLLALGASLALKLWLAQRQLHKVAANRARVPEAFADSIQLEAHQKAADYTITNTRGGGWNWSTVVCYWWAGHWEAVCNGWTAAGSSLAGEPFRPESPC